MKRVPALILVALSLSGCTLDFSRDREPTWEQPEPAPTPPPQPAIRPPSVDTIDIPDWPPLGGQGYVQVGVSDPDANLMRVDFEFRHGVSRSVSGASSSTGATGAQLGEGFGTLTVTATDRTLAFARREVQNLLVDLTPPKIVLGQTVLPADGVLELWVGDAWVLGRVELTFAGMTSEHAFQQGYPETLGVTWDYSLVKFPVSIFPAVEGEATLVATDAAGNSAIEELTLVLDGKPPVVGISSPADGAVLGGVFDVVLSASDPGGGPVWLELSAGGTPIATATGPTATLSVDTSELVSGPTTLTAVATDRAGNQSTATRAVVIQ